jgi:hypothetical protein
MKEKLEERAAAEIPHTLKRRNPLSVEMKSPQRVAARDCRSPMLRKLQSSCSPLAKPDLSSPSDGPPSPCSRACKDVCRQTSLSGRRQRLRSVNMHVPFASTPKPAKRPNGLQRSRTSPRRSMVGRWSVVIVLGVSSSCVIDPKSEPKSRYFFGHVLETLDVRCSSGFVEIAANQRNAPVNQLSHGQEAKSSSVEGDQRDVLCRPWSLHEGGL